ALNYTRNHWAELTRYLDDPSLPIDNNECEQLMKDSAPHWCGKDRLFDRKDSAKSWYFCTFAGYRMAT
ncbi:MAG: transposase, partial [Pirellulaceae bacterium]